MAKIKFNYNNHNESGNQIAIIIKELPTFAACLRANVEMGWPGRRQSFHYVCCVFNANALAVLAPSAVPIIQM